jgi:hypothetical protein
VMPLPSEETTPPVMKMYLADFDSIRPPRRRADWFSTLEAS